MKTTTSSLLTNNYAVTLNKTKATVNSFKQYETINELKIKAAIKVLETVVTNLEKEVAILRRKKTVN